jgi:putative N-acetyltransferase (TIGR04045 family)
VSAVASRSTAPAEALGHECRVAGSLEERTSHFAVRRAVFVVEQRLFPVDDRDEWDEEAGTLHAVGVCDHVTGGAVRLYPVDDEGLWKGDRLAVLPAYRHGAMGASLVRFAVSTAGALGGSRMIAMIQLPNVAFFRSLGWSETGPIEQYHGVAHQPMDIPLRAVSRPAR